MSRVLPNEINSGSDPQMTVDKCAKWAYGKGYKYIGLQYSVQCWAGNSLASAIRLGVSSACTMPCGGDISMICGGPWALSIFETGEYRK